MAQDKIANRRLVIIGGSSGSLEVIMGIMGKITPSFPVPVLIILHRGPSTDSLLHEVLGMRSTMIISEVEEKEKMLPGHAYFAPADYHVLIEEDGTFSLDYSEKVYFSRPSIDVTMISAAHSYGAGVIAVLLSGANEDGVQGLIRIQAAGGYCIVQDPQDAIVEYMPRQAIRRMKPDAVLPGHEIGQTIIGLCS